MGKPVLVQPEKSVFGSRSLGWAKLFCPFAGRGEVGSFCVGEDCGIFLTRFEKHNPTKVVFAGCSLLWIAFCTDMV